MDKTFEILNTLDLEKIKEHLDKSYNNIIKFSQNNISKIIKLYNICINSNVLLKINNYKNINYYDHYNIIYKYIPYVNDELKLILIQLISDCMHGQFILEKMPEIMNSLTVDYIEYIVKLNSATWTFPIFLYYLKLMKNCNINFYEWFIINNYCNTDDRIYKYMVNNNNELKLLKDDENIISNIISYLFNKNIPCKYILRRLKYLNIVVPELNKYFDNIISKCISIQTMSIIPDILKYYYTSNLKNEHMSNIINYLLIYDFSKMKTYFINIYNLLSTPMEKNVFLICGLFKLGTSYGLNMTNCQNNFEEIKPTLIKIFQELKYILNYINLMNPIEFKNMVDNIGFHNISTCFIMNEDDKYIKQNPTYYLMPFMVAYGDDYYAKNFNKLRYHLSRYIRNIKRKTLIIRKLKLYPIINEINNKLKLNKIPAYHLYPGQLQNFKNVEFLLKEKADGVLVNNIPMFGLTNIKAEYMEELDLYLVFDVDDLDSPINRHNYIHSNHSYGQKMIPIINNEEEFIIELTKERNKLKEFLDLPYDNYRWYPKPAWKIINIENFIEPFINLINMKNDYIINSIIKLDGLILTPLNINNNNNYNYREIKIKPKNMYSIDLLYKNNCWIDRDGYKWDIVCNEQLKDNQIWRIYFNSASFNSTNFNSSIILEAKEIRHDKIKPNPHNVVVNIIDLYNLEYKYNYKNIYHDNINNNINISWNKIINDNNKNLKYMLNKMINNNINIINNILDCGCGSGRVIKYLNKFNKYVGVDIDMDMIGKAVNKYINNNINFMYCDLTTTNYPNILNDTFNVITCINSIMHFMNDNFWNKINSITTKSAKMLVNIVDINNINNINNDYYMEIKNNKLYYKFPIHNTIKEEELITDFNIKCLNYGWKIVEEYKSNNNNITDNYKWIILIKNN